MIPLRDKNPSQHFPIVNLFIIFLNIAVYIYQYLILPDKLSRYFVFSLGCIPYEITHMVDLSPPNLVPIPLTMFTSMFIHGSFFHLLSNMLFLWIFGDNVEDRLGHLNYLIFFILCGLLAIFVHILFNPASKLPCIGASGAISGVMGAYMLFFPRARIKTLFVLFVIIQIVDIPAFIMIGYWIFVQIISGVSEIGHSGGIAWFAHIGGFFSGVLLAPILRRYKVFK